MSVRGDEATVASNARWTALWTSLIVFVLSLVLWVKFDTGEAGLPVRREGPVAAGVGVGYKMGVDGISVLFVLLSTAADADLHPGELGVDRTGGARVHARLPRPGNDDGGHVLRARLRGVLHVLRGRADPDVPDHRDLGRAAAGLFGVQVLSLHAHRLGADAAGAAGDVVPGRHDRHRRAAEDTDAGRHAELVVPGLPRVFRGEGADVAGAHLAARCACRGAHGRLGHPGRRAAEDGRLRVPALLRADAAAARRRISRR